MRTRKRFWSLLVKPTHDCNLNCMYCYDEPMRRKYAGCRMSYEMIDHILKLATDYAEEIHWIWHGGEPMLMGTDWYKGVQELFYKYSSKSKITQSMQSNGILLGKDWAKLNKNYGIDIGISYDALSQETRFQGRESSVEDNIKSYISCGGTCGAITVVNKSNYTKLIEIYNHYKNELKMSFSFNEVFVTEKSIENDLNLTYKEFATEFEKFFKYWIYDTDNPIQERTAISFFELIIGKKHNICSYSDCRHNWISVNPAGIIYPCDRYVPEIYEMGNIMDFNSIYDIYEARGHKIYSEEVEERLNTHCRSCGYVEFCKGGCNANHITVAGNAAGVDESYCESFRQKFKIMYSLVRDIDIYKDRLNNELIKSIMLRPVFTINEIDEVFKEELSIEIKNDKYKEDLLNSLEHSIFRLFNKHNDNELYSEEYWKPEYAMNLNVDDLDAIKLVKGTRKDLIREVLYRNIDEINLLIDLKSKNK